jgi:adenylate kinase family enzyme
LEATPGTPARSLRVHILGASGSGTSTLGAALAAAADASHLDTDDFYWEPTDPPYETPRPPDVRLALLTEALECRTAWVLSGSLCGWGDVFIPRFDLVVFIHLPPDIRMARLARREVGRYSAAAIAPGGVHRAKYEAFMAWAAAYETGSVERNRTMHEQWLTTLPCPVLRLTTVAPVTEHLEHVVARLSPRA